MTRPGTYRVLLAHEFYPPFIGGAELQTQILARGLAARDHVVTVATSWKSGLPEYERDVDVDVYRLRGLLTRVAWFSKDSSRRYHPPLPDPGITAGLRRLIRRFRPHVVHASGWMAYSCALAVRGSSVPMVLSVRDYGYSCAVRTLMQNGVAVCNGPAVGKCLRCAAERYGWPKAAAAVGGVLGAQSLLAGQVDGVHVLSRYVEAIVRRDFLPRAGRGDNERSLSVIPGIMVPEAGGDTDQSGVAEFLARLPDRPFILFVGALQLHKGLSPLLEAYRQLDGAPPLVLIGTAWPDTPTSFPAGVTVLRNVPHPYVMQAWQRCLFGVVPSVWPEPLGGTVREGMSQGKAVIGSAIGGIVDMVEDGQTGLLVEPGNSGALQHAMRTMIADPDLRERMGRVAREYACKEFAAETIVPRFEALYARTIAATNTKQY
jgi:glycosyltransferase involved in cell wall biosynthesis